MTLRNLTAGLLVVSSLAACAQQPGYQQGYGTNLNKEQIGTVIGAVGGAAAGAQFGKGQGRVASIAAATLLGAALGGQIGASMDRADVMYYEQTSQQALETARSGTTLEWQNPDSGNRGTVTPLNVVQNSTGQYCREYSQTIWIDGQAHDGHGMACRQPDGSWAIQ